MACALRLAYFHCESACAQHEDAIGHVSLDDKTPRTVIAQRKPVHRVSRGEACAHCVHTAPTHANLPVPSQIYNNTRSPRQDPTLSRTDGSCLTNRKRGDSPPATNSQRHRQKRRPRLGLQRRPAYDTHGPCMRTCPSFSSSSDRDLCPITPAPPHPLPAPLCPRRTLSRRHSGPAQPRWPHPAQSAGRGPCTCARRGAPRRRC